MSHHSTENMKVGDLVKWSEVNEAWHYAHCVESPDTLNTRRRGIIVDENPKYFFVFWEDGAYLAQESIDLEVISEGKS